MIRIVVVYHSGAGHTQAVAVSVQEGIDSVDGVSTTVLNVDELNAESSVAMEHWATLDQADAIVFGSPTYMGSVSADFKRFVDQTGNRWYNRAWMDKLAAGFTVGGGLSGDKQSALQAIHTFACQHGMIWVSMGVGVGEAGIDRLSSSLGLMCQADNVPANQSPPPEDHATARAFGARVARAALRWGMSDESSQS